MRRLIGVVILGLVVTGCGGPGGGNVSPPVTPTADMSSTAAPGRASVQLRVVLATTSGSPAPEPVEKPPAEWAARFAKFGCSQAVQPRPDPDGYLLACDGEKAKFLLAPAAWHGTVVRARAGVPDGQEAWVVNVTLDPEGARVMAQQSRELLASGGRLALVVDGRVLSAPGFDGVITDGDIQISGGFNEASANALADRLAGSRP